MKTLLNLVLLLYLSQPGSSLCPWTDPELLPWSAPSTWPEGPPSPGSHVHLTSPVLLDTDTPRLGRLDIYQGGRLVFSPNTTASLTAKTVRLGPGGSLVAGSEDCPHPAEARIVLTGEPGGAEDCFGDCPKGLFVEAGGSLDLHGMEKLSWTILTRTLRPSQGLMELHLAEPGRGWEQGDRLVIASTDYNMEQAEEVDVDECAGNVCTVWGDIRYEHYGEIYKGVDMRAEVGLLTRNIKISGETKDANDTYGGHIKAWEGFDTFKISGVELTKMGQQGFKGRYPIHWHLVGHVDPTKTYAANNSLHHNFQRCITVHGTHGVTVSDNVAYSTMGHCYFLEDGGEKFNTFHNNLGLLTKPGTTIPSDRRPATFWVTSPLNTLTGNHAAGSAGIGIWYIFGENVTGPSADLNLYQPGEAFRTAILPFEDNTVHSNVRTGFMFGQELLADQDFSGQGDGGHTEKCDPRQDPLDPDSPPAVHYVTGLTAYKNIKENVWNDCRSTQWSLFKSSDAPLGITMQHDNWLYNSTFIGESSNLGEPNMVRLRNGTRVMWHRSTPAENGRVYLGLHLYDGNPDVDNNQFGDFYDDEYKLAGAIGFRKPHAGVIPTLFRGSSFDFQDGVEGNFIKGQPNGTWGGKEDTDIRGIVFDWDGSITGIPLSTVVKDRPFFTSSLCSSRPHWGNMSVCPHRYSEAGGTGASYDKLDILVTRDDIPEHPEIALEAGGGSDPWHLHLSVDHSYIYSFRNHSLPAAFTFLMLGLDSGHSQQVGFCVPLGVPDEEIVFHGKPAPVEVESYLEMVEDGTGAAFYWDREVGVVFRKFKVYEARTAEDRERCVPTGHDCPEFRIETGFPGDTDCTQRAYPKYSKHPIV